jgi:MFS family permease
MALDQTIIATALPSIASDFRAISRLSWIASGYFLPQVAQLHGIQKWLSDSFPSHLGWCDVAIRQNFVHRSW